MKTTIYAYALRATGLLVVLGLINWFLIAKPLGYTASEIVGYLSMILSLSMIFFAIRHYRTRYGKGVVTFGQGFRIGILITLITSALFFVYTALYFMIWGADFKAWADSHFKATMAAKEYQQFLEQMAQPLYSNPAFQGLVMFLTVFFVGLIITLISTTILKKA